MVKGDSFVGTHFQWVKHTPKIRLMKKILHHLIGRLSYYLQGSFKFNLRWCRISSIESMLSLFHGFLRWSNGMANTMHPKEIAVMLLTDAFAKILPTTVQCTTPILRYFLHEKYQLSSKIEQRHPSLWSLYLVMFQNMIIPPLQKKVARQKIQTNKYEHLHTLGLFLFLFVTYLLSTI